MMLIAFPKAVDLTMGTPCKINGFDVVMKRENDYLVYTDENKIVNRCKILHSKDVSELPMPDGRIVEGISFTCASHGQDDCEVVQAAGIPGCMVDRLAKYRKSPGRARENSEQ